MNLAVFKCTVEYRTLYHGVKAILDPSKILLNVFFLERHYLFQKLRVVQKQEISLLPQTQHLMF